MCSFDHYIFIHSQLLFENLLLRISPMFPVTLFLYHLFVNCFVEIYLLARLIYVEYSLDLSGSPRFLGLYHQDHLIHFPVFFSTFFSMTFSVNFKLSLRSLPSAFKSFIFFIVISKLPLIIFTIFFSCLLLKFFCKYTLNQNFKSFFNNTSVYFRHVEKKKLEKNMELSLKPISLQKYGPYCIITLKSLFVCLFV